MNNFHIGTFWSHSKAKVDHAYMMIIDLMKVWDHTEDETVLAKIVEDVNWILKSANIDGEIDGISFFPEKEVEECFATLQFPVCISVQVSKVSKTSNMKNTKKTTKHRFSIIKTLHNDPIVIYHKKPIKVSNKPILMTEEQYEWQKAMNCNFLCATKGKHKFICC